jgi:predicted enzyme related to lactoylglutathione lyase
MAKANGIGGIFFRARDTEALAQWYQRHLGIPGFWSQDAGPTVFAPFKTSSDYFAADKQWMINLRVGDLDGLIAQLSQSGIPVETRPEEWDSPETGRFARIHDPEGNPIELWEPAEEPPAA